MCGQNDCFKRHSTFNYTSVWDGTLIFLYDTYVLIKGAAYVVQGNDGIVCI